MRHPPLRRLLALSTLVLAATPAAAALPPDRPAYAVAFSDFAFELVDLDPADDLLPQVTTTEAEFGDFFSGQLFGSLGESPLKMLSGFVGPKTEVAIRFRTEITLQALDRPGSFALLLYEALGFVEGQGYVDLGRYSGSLDSEPDGAYTGLALQRTEGFDVSFSLINDLDETAPRYVGYELSAGATSFEADVGSGPLTPAPEPASWALMGVGLGAVGWAAGRRRTRR